MIDDDGTFHCGECGLELTESQHGRNDGYCKECVEKFNRENGNEDFESDDSPEFDSSGRCFSDAGSGL